jgi:ABC-type polysaccharide/polyol phosphate transport system ATPase subunit
MKELMDRNKVIVHVDGIYKSYLKHNPSLRELFFHTNKDLNKNDRLDDNYVLNNISFELRKGEAFGIIGKNGSGKSTLLQIITGTLRPSLGKCFISGRVSALLELGSGFNPDFTGRENVYLAAAIIGLSKDEINNLMPSIEQFADIGAFLDKPIRTYSTGMVMRVAFAVAVAVQPDVLIIDEALSVGDILFQQKCNIRIREMLSNGVTLLVVTHDTSFVLNICNRAMWLDNGHVRCLGSASVCVQEYISAIAAESSSVDRTNTLISNVEAERLPNFPSIDFTYARRLGNQVVEVTKLWCLDDTLYPSTNFNIGDWCNILLVIRAKKRIDLVSAGCEIKNRHGQVIFATGLRVIKQLIEKLEPDENKLVSIRLKLDVSVGQYTVDVGCGAGDGSTNIWDRLLAALIINVSSKEDDQIVHGLVRLPSEIRVAKV